MLAIALIFPEIFLKFFEKAPIELTTIGVDVLHCLHQHHCQLNFTPHRDTSIGFQISTFSEVDARI